MNIFMTIRSYLFRYLEDPVSGNDRIDSYLYDFFCSIGKTKLSGLYKRLIIDSYRMPDIYSMLMDFEDSKDGKGEYKLVKIYGPEIWDRLENKVKDNFDKLDIGIEEFRNYFKPLLYQEDRTSMILRKENV